MRTGPTKRDQRKITVIIVNLYLLKSSYQTQSEPAFIPSSIYFYLVLDVCVFEHQGQWSDVLPVHTLTASDLNGMFDAFVNLFGGGLPYVGKRAVRKGGQDLQEKNMIV